MTDACPECGETERHHRLCSRWEAEEAHARAVLARVDAILEERATGHRRFRSAAAALRWYANTYAAWASARGLPLDPEREGTGAPNRGADSPRRELFAQIAGAMKRAKKDDQERHLTKPAPLERWIGEHFGAGRAYAWIAEEAGTWTQLEVEARVERALRVVREHLREVGALEDGHGDAV